MTLFDRLKYLANKQGKSINDIERDMDYSKNTLYRLKSTNPSAEKLKELADYFHVSTDYLLGRTDNPKIISDSAKETELRKALEHVMSFDGKELTENDKDAIITYMMGRHSNEYL